MDLNKFVSTELRALPIFILADTSGSMDGPKINELNLALREMLNSLKHVEGVRGKFQLAVIGFGGNVKVIQQLANIEEVSLSEMSASGNTPMGEAFDVLCKMIEDKEVISSRAYAPTIVLISDGKPDFTGDYLSWSQLKKLHTGPRSAKCQRLAMGIGDDADIGMLKAFVNNPEIPIYKAKDASGISAFFRWVTMSTIARMNSVNPNVLALPAPMASSNALVEIK
jgi:uncharacterized protein YegL